MDCQRRVEVDSSSYVLDDFFKVEEAFLRFERFDGAMSPTIRRLNFERSDAVAVVIVDRQKDELILAEQFRYPTYEKGPGWMVELVAGIVEEGEDPEATVRREVLEETGYEVDQIEPIAEFYLSPGGSSERIRLYYAEVTESSHAEEGGGVAAEGEDIRLVRLPRRDVGAALAESRFADAKTLIGLMWLQPGHWGRGEG